MSERCDDCGRPGWIWTQEPTSLDEGGEALCHSCLAVLIDEVMSDLRYPVSPPLDKRLGHVHCDGCHGDDPSLVSTLPWVWTAPNGTSECAECVAERLGGRPGLFSSAWRQALAREQAFLSA